MLKILQVRLQQYVNWEIPGDEAGFRKGRGTRDQIADIHCTIKAREFEKKKSPLLTMPVPLTVWITTDCGKFLEMGIPDHLTCFLRNLFAGQEATAWTGSKLGKEYNKAIYCHPAYLTSMQSKSCEMLDWMRHKLESRFPGEISITSDMQMTPPLWQKVN